MAQPKNPFNGSLVLGVELSIPQNLIKSKDHVTILSCLVQQSVPQLRGHRDLCHTRYN